MRWLLLLMLVGCAAVPAFDEVGDMQITSVFEHNGKVPSDYTCNGIDKNPPLTVTDIPEGTETLALIMDDPDASGWVHWIVWNIPPGDIQEASVPGEQGVNSWGRNDWGGPCPPDGTHRYVFKLYALDTMLDLPVSARKAELEAAMDGHILAKTLLTGKYRQQ